MYLGVLGSLVTILSQFFRRVWRCRNFEKRPIFGKDMDKSLVARFLTHSAYKYIITYISLMCAYLLTGIRESVMNRALPWLRRFCC